MATVPSDDAFGAHRELHGLDEPVAEPAVLMVVVDCNLRFLIGDRFGHSVLKGRDVHEGEVVRIALAGAAGADAVEVGKSGDGVHAIAPGDLAIARRHVGGWF